MASPRARHAAAGALAAGAAWLTYYAGWLLRAPADEHIRLVFADISDHVRDELDRSGVTEIVGANAYFENLHDAARAFERG